MFDLLDGKQARRTGTSSPLGLIFDHGCDAATTFLFTMGLGTSTRLDSTLYFALIWMMTAFPFFLNTWEEYYTGELNLPVINGVSEGAVIACLIMISGGLFPEFWVQQATIFGHTIKFNEIAVILGLSSGCLFGLISVYNVLTRFKDQREDAVWNIFIFFYLVFTLMLVIFYADSEIIRSYPKVIILVYGFAFAKLVGHLQLAHLAGSRFLQYRKSLLISFFVLGSISILDHFGKNSFISIDYFIVFFLVLHIIGMFLSYLLFSMDAFCVLFDRGVM